MIGKDMTKMTLPVSFNEPTSLLQRVTEDMVSRFAIAISKSHMSAMALGALPHCGSTIQGYIPVTYFLFSLSLSWARNAD